MKSLAGFKILFVIMLLSAVPANGEIFKWTDSRGVDHYTNSMYEVPDRYRNKVKTLDLGIVENKTPSEAQPQGGGSVTVSAKPEEIVKQRETRKKVRADRKGNQSP